MSGNRTTKYILAGGNDRESYDYGKALAAEVFKTCTPPLRVVSCAFASPREDWEAKFSVRQEWFKQAFGGKTKVVMAFPDNFREQVREADVVYFHGGDDDLIAYRLSQFDKLSELFAGKVVAGSSAGADWLSAGFWTCDWRAVRQGSGLTPLNIIPHYESATYGQDDPRGPIDWGKAKEQLQIAIGPDQKVTPLREGEFISIEL